MERRPATLRPSAPVPPRIIQYLAIGLALYTSVMLVVLGSYQFFSSSVPSFQSLGVDIKRAARDALFVSRDDARYSSLGPAFAALAGESRSGAAAFVAFGLMLGYVAWVLPMEWKGLPHLSVAVLCVMQAFAQHQVVSNAHAWGALSVHADTIHVYTVMRIVYAFLALTFWVLAVLSWTMSWVARKQKGA